MRNASLSLITSSFRTRRFTYLTRLPCSISSWATLQRPAIGPIWRESGFDSFAFSGHDPRQGDSFMRFLIAFSLIAALPQALPAHPGGLAGDGCHNDRKNGGRHCHGARKASAPARSKALRAYSSDGGAFANCSAARAAGAAPVMRGDAGYGSHLDRDGDGVGCE